MNKSWGYVVLSYYYQANNRQFGYVRAKKGGKPFPLFRVSQ